jgi:hypothetical protein
MTARWMAHLIFASLPVELRCVLGRVSRGGLGSHTENHRGKECALRFITVTVT